MSSAAVEMAAVTGDEADWMMGGHGEADEVEAERLTRHAGSDRRILGGASGSGGSGSVSGGGSVGGVAAERSVQSSAADATSAVDTQLDWQALITAALADTVDNSNTSSELAGLSALSAALSPLSASSSATTVDNGTAGHTSSSAASDLSSASQLPPQSVLTSVWPFLPSLYSSLSLPSSSSSSSSSSSPSPPPARPAVMFHLVECVMSLSVAFPASVLLARSDLMSSDVSLVSSVDSSSSPPPPPPPPRPPCLWSALSGALDTRLSQLTSTQSSIGALCQLLRCCASLLPSTLSVLSVYGDVLGCVLPAVSRVTDRVRQLLLDPTVPPLLTAYAAGVARGVLLTHTPIHVVDGMDPLLPASLSSSTSSRPSASTPSSSSLASFPALSSESALYFPTVSAFDLRLLSDSHPDLDSNQLSSVAASLLSQVTEAVQQRPVQSSTACIHLELVLFVVRQRSVSYAALCLPVLLRVAGQLTSLPVSSPVSSALQTVRLGLFSLFRLSSCSQYWSAMLTVLSQPASSILAMEAVRINKQRSSSHTQLSDARNQQQQQLQQQSSQSTGSSLGEFTVPSQLPVGDGAMSSLREVVDIESAAIQPLLSSAFSLPLPLICDLIVRSLHSLPMSSTGQPYSAHSQQQQVLIQMQAATKQMHWRAADMSHTLTAADNKSSVQPPLVPTDPSPSSLTVPPLNTQPLSNQSQSALSRLCFVRLLSTNLELTAGQRTMAALRAALLPNITVAGVAGSVFHTVEVTDSDLLTHWAAEHDNNSADQRKRGEYDEEYEQDEEEAEEDDEADNSVSTRSLLSSLRLSSSLSSTAEYSALLSYILSDVIERYELAITFAYKLARLTPHSINITATAAQGDSNQLEEEDEDEQQATHSASSQQLSGAHGNVELAPASIDRQRGKRHLVAANSAALEQGSNKQQRTAYSGTEATQGEPTQAAIAPRDDRSEQSQQSSLDVQRAATKRHSVEDGSSATDPLSLLPVVSPPLEDDSGGVVRSARFQSVLSSFFRLHGGVEYQQLVEGVITALNSALFGSTSTPTVPVVGSPACAALLQLLLDLPLLPPSVWSCIDRYLSSSSSSSWSVGLLALRVLIEQRPPAANRAVHLLLHYVAIGASSSLRQQCVDLAVECVATSAASLQLRSLVVQRAINMAAAVSHSTFLADLPVIAVHIVVPPPPLYEDTQLPSTAAAHMSETSAGVAGSSVVSVDSSISSLLSAVVGGVSGSSDGSEEADEARRRAIQQLIADGARRKKEFDKLVLRRQLLLKEKELRDRQAEDRQQQRKQTTHTHLALLLALIHSSPRIPFNSTGDNTRQLFERLWTVYAATNSAEPARKLIHSALPAMVVAVGPTLPLLTSLQSQPVACDPCVLHVLQLLCTAPPLSSDELHQSTQLAALSAGAREQSLVHPTSAVSVVCWYLYHTRRGDARFIIPLLPMLRADQLRRCLHRIVALPNVHLKVALHRMLRPHISLAAKGNKLSQPHPQPLSPAELVIALHRIDQHRRAAATNNKNTPDADSATPPVSLPLSFPLAATADLSVCSASSAVSNYPSDDGAWLRSLIAAVQLCFASVDLYPASTLASVVSALRVDRPLSRLFLRTCIQCVQLQPSLTSFVLSVVHSLIRSERSMVAVSLLWEGVLKLASLSLPNSLDLLLDLPDEGVGRLFGELGPHQLLSAVQLADKAAADATLDKAAGRKPTKSIKQTPLQMCQVAAARAVLQQPQRVRHVYRKHVILSQPQHYQQTPPATHQMRHTLIGAASDTLSQLPSPLPPPPPPPPSTATSAVVGHFVPSSAFGERPGWSSSHLSTQPANPPMQPSHAPTPFTRPAAATAAGGGGSGVTAASVTGSPSMHYPHHPSLPVRPPPLSATAGPPNTHHPFAAPIPPFHRPFAGHPPHINHPTHRHTHQHNTALHSAPPPLPLPPPQSAMGGGWKSVRIPTAAQPQPAQPPQSTNQPTHPNQPINRLHSSGQ